MNKTITVSDAETSEDMEMLTLITLVDNLIVRLDSEPSHEESVRIIKTLAGATMKLYCFYKDNRGECINPTTFNLH